MKDYSLRRRTFLASGLTASLVGTAGCLRKKEPEASHWAAGIRWSDPPGEVFRERGFSPGGGSIFTGPANTKNYFRVNGGELIYSQLSDDSVPADRGDHIEYIIDFDRRRQGEVTVFEYTIPDDPELVGVLAGFAECLHYRGTDEWRVRPLNVNLGTDLLGRQRETLLVTVRRERGDENPDWFVWGHDESTRDDFHDLAANADAEVDLEFIDQGEIATFSPSAFHLLGMLVFDGTDRLARITYRDPHNDS